MDWFKELPWWVKWAAMAGFGLVSMFAGVLSPNWQLAGLAIGILFLCAAGLGTAWHLWRNIGPNSTDSGTSLREAARKLYGALRGSYLASIWEKSAGLSNDAVLNDAAMLLFDYVDLEGKRHPSPNWEKIDKLILRQMKACDGAVAIRHISGHGRVEFDEVRLATSSQLSTAIQSIKELANDRGPRFSDSKKSERSTFEARTGGEISARDAQIPPNLPFTLARAETGGKIVMDGTKFVVSEALPSKPDALPETPIVEAIEHVAKAIGDIEQFSPRARHEIRQSARHGFLRVNGRREIANNLENQTTFSAVHSIIPADYWANSVISVGGTSHESSYVAGCQTEPETAASWHPTDYTLALNHYADLRVSMKEIQRFWPPKDAS